MKLKIVGLLVFFVLALAASVQAGPISCKTGSPAASASCNPGQTYGVLAGSGAAVQFLDQDLGRSGILLQVPASSTNTCCVEFNTDGTGASTSAPQNCYDLTKGSPMYFTNFKLGGVGGISVTGNLSVIGETGNCNLAFTFFQ